MPSSTLRTGNEPMCNNSRSMSLVRFGTTYSCGLPVTPWKTVSLYENVVLFPIWKWKAILQWCQFLKQPKSNFIQITGNAEWDIMTFLLANGKNLSLDGFSIWGGEKLYFFAMLEKYLKIRKIHTPEKWAPVSSRTLFQPPQTLVSPCWLPFCLCTPLFHLGQTELPVCPRCHICISFLRLG